MSNSIYAQEWTGRVNSDWNNPSNWSEWPLGNEDIEINPSNYLGAAASPVISSNSVFSPAEITVENGAVLTIAANLTTRDDVEVVDAGSQIIVNAGIFSVNPGDRGRLIIESGGGMTINGGNVIADERFIIGEDALITMNDGQVTSGQRLIVGDGGKFIQHGGNVSVSPTFAIGDGSANGSSGYELHGGTLSITGEMEFENETGHFDPYFLLTGGELVVNGDIVWFGESPGSGTPRWILDGGTATVSGLIHNVPLSTVNMYLKVAGDASFIYNGPRIETIHPADTIIQTGNASFIFNQPNTIYNAGVVIVTKTITTFNANTILQGSGSYQLHHLLIGSGVTLHHQSPAQIGVSGDIIKNGTLQANANTIILNGAGRQSLRGSGAYALHRLTLDNTSGQGIDLYIPMTVSGHLLLHNGILQTSDSALLEILDNAGAGSGHDSSFVNGPMVKAGDDVFVFPVGKNSAWRRIAMSAPVGVESRFKAQYFDTPFAFSGPVASPLSSISSVEYWMLERLAGNATPVVELFWEDAASSGITDCDAFSMTRWDGISWQPVASTPDGECTGDGAGRIQSDIAVDGFGPFTFGYYTVTTAQQITICDGESFSVGNNVYTSQGSYIDTLSGANMNDSIVITNLEVIILDTDVTVSGNILQSHQAEADSYQWVDCDADFQPVPGETGAVFTAAEDGYYAVVIMSRGCTDTSACVRPGTVSANGIVPGRSIRVYPNPFQSEFQILAEGAGAVGKIMISDSRGETVYSGSMDQSARAKQVRPDVPPGIYFLRYKDDEIEKTVKLVCY